MTAPAVLQAAALMAARSPSPSPSVSAAGGGGVSAGAAFALVLIALIAGGIGGIWISRRGLGVRPVTLDDQRRLAADRLLTRLGMLWDQDCRTACVWMAQSERGHQQALAAALDAQRAPLGPRGSEDDGSEQAGPGTVST